MIIDLKKLYPHLIRKGMTLAAFHMMGVSSETLRRIRKGVAVKPATVERIAEILGVEPEAILAAEKTSPAKPEEHAMYYYYDIEQDIMF